MKTKVQVKDLQAGDVLSSGSLVFSTENSLECPEGKIRVEVQYPGGQRKRQLWNKATTVTVINR